MTGIYSTAVSLCLLVVLSTSCTFRSVTDNKPKPLDPLPGYGSLNRFPFHEAWYGMYFQEDKVGYSHFKIDLEGPNFCIASDSLMRLAAGKKTDEIAMKEKVIVRPDLSMLSFESVVHMNEKEMRMSGRSEGNHLVVDIRVGGETLNRRYPIDGKVFHSSAISLMPALKGLKEGESYSFVVFNAEKQKMDTVEQQVFLVKGTPGPKGAVWKVKNKYGPSVVYSWLDGKGLTVIEKAMAGSLITLLEDAAAAKDFLERKGAPRAGATETGYVLSGASRRVGFAPNREPGEVVSSRDQVLKCKLCALIIVMRA
ncbi:MAG: hypothetical protein NTW27_03265 [Deltaproteobacteria bacterium]|nr:hypothetical protein [Deltaproteobacteria bacterium]